MKTFEAQQLLFMCRYCAFVVAVSLWNVVPSSAQPVHLTPGTTTSIEIADTTPHCSEVQDVSSDNVTQFWPPKAVCIADLSKSPPLQVYAISAFSTGFSQVTSSSLQNLSATARLIRKIQIPIPAQEPYSSTLRVQVSTEVSWSGGFVAAGTPSTFAQAVATLQVRDITDATAQAPGPVVASNTFFVERFDAQLDLPSDISLGGLVEALNLVDAVDVSSSSGADVTAFLKRGRTYAIELEAKCDVGAPAVGFGFCLFSGSALALPEGNPLSNVFADDGFQVAPFEVTVESDPVEDAVNQL